MKERLVEKEMPEFPGVKIWTDPKDELPFMVRIGEVCQHKLREKKINKFMRGQTAPLITGATKQDYIYLHDFANYLHKEATGKELFWD